MPFMRKTANTYRWCCSRTWCCLAIWILAASGQVTAQSQAETQIMRMEPSGTYRVNSDAIHIRGTDNLSGIKAQIRPGRRIVPVIDLKQNRLIRVDTLPEPILIEPQNRLSAQPEARTWTTVMTEGFEGAWPSAGWKRSGSDKINGVEITWAPWAYHPASGKKSCFAQGTVRNPSIQYTVKAPPGEFISSSMRYGPINLEGVTDARITFKLSYQLGEGDYIGWGATADTSEVLYITGYHQFLETNWPDYETVTYNLNTDPFFGSVCGKKDVFFFLIYLSDDRQDNNKASFVDDFSLEVSTDPLPGLSLDVSEWAVPSCGGTSGTVHVNSSGEALEYSVSDDAFWLTLSESDGATPGGFTMTAPDNQTGLTRTASVTIKTIPHVAASGSPAILTVTQISPSDSGWTTLMTEGFEGEWPSDGWTLDSNTLYEDGTPITWGPVEYGHSSGVRSAFPHGSVVDSFSEPAIIAASGTTIQSLMRYGPFSLEQAADARFKFRLSCHLFDGDRMLWGVSAGDPDTSRVVTREYSLRWGFPQFETVTFSLKNAQYYGNLCGRSDVYIHFLYIADDIDGRNEAVRVDDIYLQVKPITARLSVDAGEWAAPPAGGASGAIQVTSVGEAVQYRITDSAGWLTASPPSGTTPGAFHLSASPNRSGSARIAEVSVDALAPAGTAGSPATIRVTQDPMPPPRISLSDSTWSAPAAGGVSDTIRVSSSGEAVLYTVSSGSDWLTLSKSDGITTGRFTLTALANDGDSARTAMVTVTAVIPAEATGSPAMIIVTQAPIPPPRISLSDSTWSAPAAGGVSDTIRVSSSGEAVLYTVSGGSDWLTLSESGGTTPGGFTLTATANDADSARTAMVTVTAVMPAEATGSPAMITVTQPKAPVPASIEPVSPSTIMPGGEFQVDILVGDPVTVTDLFKLRFDLTFSNTGYVDYACAEPGPFFGTDAELLPVSDDAAGKVGIALSRKPSSGGVSGAGVAVRVRFRVLPDAPENALAEFSLSGIAAEDPVGNPVPFTASGKASTVMTYVGDGGDAASIPIPSAFELSQNFPNPFNPATEIRFGLPHSGEAELKVFDGSGRVVAVLFEGFRQAGYHSVTFNAGKLPSGSYTCRLKAGRRVLTRKMVLVK
jgi:hypothetical protein